MTAREPRILSGNWWYRTRPLPLLSERTMMADKEFRSGYISFDCYGTLINFDII